MGEKYSGQAAFLEGQSAAGRRAGSDKTPPAGASFRIGWPGETRIFMSDAEPRKTLTVIDGMAIIVGIVVGVGIFKTPSLVASSSGSEGMLLLAWLLGGVISLLGALCYAELATSYPHAGGDYHYLTRAFGNAPGFLFAWARMTVIQTGSIAMVAFLVGDYASEVFRLGEYSASYYAATIIVLLTILNVMGIRQGKWTQRVLFSAILLGLVFVVVTGYACTPPHPDVSTRQAPLHETASLGRAMIFVLLTYGGWNEAGYLSAEVRDPGRSMVRVLLLSICMITAIYLLINAVFMNSLGMAGMSSSQAIAADLMDKALGAGGTRFISTLVVLAALSTMNATIITGARTNFALGRNFSPLGFLGRWERMRDTPANALLLQGFIALLLVGLGAGARNGFVMMVEYTAPVFWFFLLLVGISVFVLRRRDAHVIRPFSVPLYPVTPLVFCAVCVYMLHASLVHTGRGSLLGVGVLLTGIPVLLLEKPGRNKK